MGFAELMQRANTSRDPEKARQYAGLIYDLSSQVQRVLSNLLEWSRLQRRTFECRPEPIEICSLIKDVIEMNTREAARKDIHFNLSASGSVYVSADRSMITTVLQNLVSNAIKYTPAAGQISIDCKVTGQQTEVSIRDTGIGISEENLKQLFTFDFSQKIGTSENNGAGLGLIICHEMIQKNNGSLVAESTPGKGSCFSFTLPLMKHDENELITEPLSQLDGDLPDDLLSGSRIVPPEALPEIISGLAPLYEEVSKVLSIENLETFSRSVTDTGEKYAISGLTGYGKTLSRLTRSHQIDQIIKLLPRFRKYLDSITTGS
jgi:anti-sigma regulatory factor (Ser/Thr protein kinase)